MNGKTKDPQKEPLRIPLDFEETLADLLKVKPPPDKKPSDGEKGEKKVKAIRKKA